MDPLTALGVASNIVSFVSFTFDLVTETRQICNSASGASETTTLIQTIARDVEQFNAALSSSHHVYPSLQALISQSSKMAVHLQDGLRKLNSKRKRSTWCSFKAALRAVWTKDQVDSFLTDLGRLQSQIMSHIQFSILNEVSDLSHEIASLSSMGQRLELQNHENLMSLKREILTALDRFSEDGMEDGRIEEYFLDQQSASPGTFDPEHPGAISFDIRKVISAMSQLVNEAERVRSDQEFLKSLYFSNIQARHRKIEAAHAKTFQWVYHDTLPGQNLPINFRDWLRNQNGLFWIHGKPGSGKSTLMKFLCQNPATMQHLGSWAGNKKLVMGSFFFWNAGTQLQKSQEGLLRSLLFEILRKCPELIPHVKHCFESDMHFADTYWSVEGLLEMYRILVNLKFPIKFCFFIDGLDEFHEENRSHVDLIHTLRSLEYSSDIKLCVSSRPWTIFDDEFRRDSKWLLKLEDLTYGDILRYVRDKFDSHPQFRRLSARDPDYDSLVELVVKRAQGVFLWVVLVVRDLQEGLTHHDSVSNLESWLLQFPPDLDEFFQHLIDSIPPRYRVHASSTFKVATMAEQPLPLVFYSFLDDLQDGVLSLELPQEEISAQDIDYRQDQMRRRLDGRTKCLLEVVNLEWQMQEPSAFFDLGVDFLHRTVRDFLLLPSVQLKLPQCDDISLTACRASLIMLSKAPFRKSDMVRMIGPLEQLFFFAREASRGVIAGSLEPPLMELLEAAEEHYNRVREKWSWTTEDPVFTGLAAQADLYFFLEKPGRVFPFRKTNAFARPLLDYALSPPRASQSISTRVVRLLLEQRSDPNEVYLGRTVFAGFVKTIRERIQVQDKDSLIEIVDLLVSHGADLAAVVDA
ncbi:hypothetical protein QBC43DRAFT_187756, partial [Cladorrhinum sp. PSN259]